MSRFSRQSLVIVVVIVVALVAQSVYLALYGDWTSYFKQRAREANILMNVQEIESRFPLALAVRQLGLVIPVGRIPVPVAIDSGTVALKLSSLFVFEGGLDYQAEMYGGKLKGSFRRGFFGKKINFDIHALNLLLERYPQLGSVMFEGRVTAHSAGAAEPDEKGVYHLVTNDVTAVIEDGHYRGGFKINGLIPVPPMANVRASLSAQLQESDLKITRFDFDSSLGKISGHGKFRVDAGMKPREGNVSFSIALTEAGATAFGSYLQLGAQGKGQPDTKLWDGTIQLKAGNNIPDIQILPRS